MSVTTTISQAVASDVYPFTTLFYDSGPGPSVIWTSTECCLIGYGYWRDYDWCWYSELRDPLKQKKLRELARDYEILVPDCKGTYYPLGLVKG